MPQSLKACPACGKQAGELIEDKTSRFLFRVQVQSVRMDDRPGEARGRSGEAMERSEARGQGQSAAEMKSPAEAGRAWLGVYGTWDNVPMISGGKGSWKSVPWKLTRPLPGGEIASCNTTVKLLVSKS